MTSDTPSRMQVVRKQEKEPRLKSFISQQLSEMGVADACESEARTCLVVARACDSPVVRALGSFAVELAAHGVKVRAILSSLEPAEGAVAQGTGEWLSQCEVRLARNPRLIDAHEFMVLGTSASWVGDSMRRDPSKRDAFESYSLSSKLAVEQACRSFERLWPLCEAVSSNSRWTVAPAPQAAEPAAADVAAAAVAAEAVPVPVPGATRH